MIKRFEELQIVERLDLTHSGSTEIYLVRHEDRLYVCKIMKKAALADQKSIQHAHHEKQALIHFSLLQHAHINNLVCTFQDQQKLYMLLQAVHGLPLHKLLKMIGPFNAEWAKLIIIQVGLIIRDFHKEGYIYRDIKASNFMIDAKGKVTMIDLGHAKKIDGKKTYTICGTTHAMPPQIYAKEGYSYEFDYYSYGILIYQLLVAKPPFGYGVNNLEIVKEMQAGITKEQLSCITCPITADLVSRLLAEPAQRLGRHKGFDEILEHDYFNTPSFLEIKDLYDGVGQINTEDPNFETYISQIVDFGISQERYKPISPDDPFYKFCN